MSHASPFPEWTRISTSICFPTCAPPLRLSGEEIQRHRVPYVASWGATWIELSNIWENNPRAAMSVGRISSKSFRRGTARRLVTMIECSASAKRPKRCRDSIFQAKEIRAAQVFSRNRSLIRQGTTAVPSDSMPHIGSDLLYHICVSLNNDSVLSISIRNRRRNCRAASLGDGDVASIARHLHAMLRRGVRREVVHARHIEPPLPPDLTEWRRESSGLKQTGELVTFGESLTTDVASTTRKGR